MLGVVFAAFAVSYLVRFAWDLSYEKFKPFATYYAAQMAVFFIFDFIPIGSIFWLHHSNFKRSERVYELARSAQLKKENYSVSLL